MMDPEEQEANILETERLTLRPLTTAQTDAAHTLWTNAEMRQFLWQNEIIDRKRAIEALEKSEADFAAHRCGLWGISLKDKAELIGFCGLHFEEAGAELMFGLLPAYWGLGIVTEAARRVVGHALEDLGIAEVVGSTDAPNAASVKVLDHLGAELVGKEQGKKCELLRYRMTREGLASADEEYRDDI